MIAELTVPTQGWALLDEGEIYAPSSARSVVFQNYALMPWMTVTENTQFAIATFYPKMSLAQQRYVICKMVSLVGLYGSEHKHPHELSGDIKQQVGIATLAINPEILLMDESFEALDTLTRAFL